jgi:hypothetical protein
MKKNHFPRFAIPFAFVLIILISYGYIRWTTNTELKQTQDLLTSVNNSLELLGTAEELLSGERPTDEQLLTNIIGAEIKEAACENVTVSDIQNHPFGVDINALLKNCIVSGYSDGTFKPNGSINRAELTKIVMGAFFTPQELQSALEFYQGRGVAYAGLPDVSINEWYAPYIALGILEEIIKGYGGEYITVNGIKDHPFKPGNPVTFGEAFKILLSAKIAVTDQETREIIQDELFYAASDLTSYSQIPPDDWTRPYVIAGAGDNLANMFPEEFVSFRHSPITRGQFAHLAVNVMSY